MQGKTKKKDRHFFDGFPDDTFSLRKKNRLSHCSVTLVKWKEKKRHQI
jgi:hypothetical protein